MNFIKEYIELCKNEKVQGLRPELEYGDWVDGGKPLLFLGEEYYCNDSLVFFEDKPKYIWLPTGDQLDDEIVNIAGYKGWYYTACYYPDDYEYEILIEYEDDDMCLNSLHRSHNKNPLIAKIEILIKLLEAK